jgi:D-alanyl-D-alanine dipeptidase
MNSFSGYSFAACFVLLLSCQPSQQKDESRVTSYDSIVTTEAIPTLPDTGQAAPTPDTARPKDSVKIASPDYAKPLVQPADSGFVELIKLDSTFVLDLRYATTDNFLKEKVYDCAKCLLRKEAALALINAHQALKKKGYRIKLFDCYRPLDVQKKMWKIMPDDRFVGNPYGNGSKHNLGVATDLTLTDSTGKELDMGTPFDFFGRESYHAYTNLPAAVLSRRRLLKQTLMEAGFNPITSEWWHYSYNRKKYKVANFKPACD